MPIASTCTTPTRPAIDLADQADYSQVPYPSDSGPSEHVLVQDSSKCYNQPLRILYEFLSVVLLP